jgi:hypothetical protein
MSKLQCWWLTMTSIIFGISDRTFNSIINNYSIESLAQILIGAILLLLVNQLYPYHLGD